MRAPCPTATRARAIKGAAIILCVAALRVLERVDVSPDTFIPGGCEGSVPEADTYERLRLEIFCLQKSCAQATNGCTDISQRAPARDAHALARLSGCAKRESEAWSEQAAKIALSAPVSHSRVRAVSANGRRREDSGVRTNAKPCVCACMSLNAGQARKAAVVWRLQPA